MKILLLSSVEHQSGSALRFRGLAGALARRGHAVHLLEPTPSRVRPETPSGVRREACPRLPGNPVWQAPLWLAHGIVAVLRTRPDVVYVLKALPNVWIPALLARWLGARVAVDLDDLDHAYYASGPTPRILEWFFRWASRSADDVTVHNETMRRRVQGIRGAGREAIFVDQGIDVARFSNPGEPRPELAEELALCDGPVLLYAGHLGPASDLGELLPSLEPVPRAYPNAHLLVVGDGRDRKRLMEIAARHLPAGFAVFVGTVPHPSVPAYYALADVSLNFLEGSEVNRHRASIKTREALAAGIPVVASRTPDSERFAEYVRIAPGNSAGEFVDAVLEELADPGRENAQAGARWLAEHGTFDVAVRELALVWEGGGTA